MDLNVARSGDFLQGQNGARFYPSLFIHLMDGKGWVQAFQFVQTTETEIILHVVPEVAQGSESLSAALQAELGEILRQKMGDELQFLVRVEESIDRTKVGKHRYVINEIQSVKVG